jgi:hypothetical protein
LTITVAELQQELREILSADSPPDHESLSRRVRSGVEAMRSQPDAVRPESPEGAPGGLVRLRPELPTVVVPDIHARPDLIISVLSLEAPKYGIERPLIHALADNRAQLVFVGDYVHAEGRARARWRKAFQEFQTGYSRRSAMDEEMTESLGALQMVALLKATFPESFHGLKGNHENIANEDKDGNLPFGKFVYEGAMVAEYMHRFYGGDPFDAVYEFEKTLPLLAVGSHFIVGHAEPQRFFTTQELLEYRSRPDVVYGLTWTANDEAEPGSVEEMLEHFLPQSDPEDRIYLGGHRPVSGLYNMRAEGQYVQIHNPDLFVAAVLTSNRTFDPAKDVVEIPDSRSAVDG